MALNPSNSGNLEQMALKGLIFSNVCLNSVEAVVYGMIHTYTDVHVAAPNVPAGETTIAVRRTPAACVVDARPSLYVRDYCTRN